MPRHAHHFEPQIASIYNHLYANADFRTPRGIAREVTKVLHTGIFVEKRINPLLPAFNFTVPERRVLASGNAQALAQEAKAIRSLYERMKKETGLYPANERLMLNDFDLIFSCLKLQGIMLSSEERDVIGDALELFRSYWSKSHGGQFFTDAQVTKLAIELLCFDPFKGDTFADICAGSGGFLLAALSHAKNLPSSRSKTELEIDELLGRVLYGQEADAEVQQFGNAALTSRTSREFKIIARGNSLLTLNPANGHAPPVPFSCAATNPPFGTKITIKDPAILSAFEVSRLGRMLDDIRACAPDILFLEKNLAILKEGGRLAIVLPYQILSGPQTERVRQWLFTKATLEAVIDLPADTFQPYTGTKASLVLVTKGTPRRRSNQHSKVFMATPRWIGHDRRGNPVYEKAPDGSETDRILTDIPLVAKAYKQFREGGDPNAVYNLAFSVPREHVSQARELRFDARYHRPSTGFSVHETSVLAKAAQTKPLRELTKRIFYPARFKRLYVDAGPHTVPFLGGTNISQLIVVTDKWLAASNPYLSQLRVKTGWILVTRSGSTGIISSVPPEWDGYALSEHVIRILPDADKLPGEYIFAFLRTRFAEEYIARGVYGSVIDEISPEYLGEMPVPIPERRGNLARIVERIATAENNRQAAIENFAAATREVESLFSG